MIKYIVIVYINSDQPFPPHRYADKDGLLAVGADLDLNRLKDAYSKGIFPWYNEGQPVLWWSPDPRMVLFPDEVHVSKSMRSVLKKGNLKVTFNTRFTDVILNCKRIEREGQHGTWITREMLEAFIQLHEEGLAQSVEVWEDDQLVGGLYGINLADKGIFCGESMFSTVSNSSKLALIQLARKLHSLDYKLIDCQVYNEHLDRMGAREIPRKKFLEYLK